LVSFDRCALVKFHESDTILREIAGLYSAY
jgi:hypothetical protein